MRPGHLASQGLHVLSAGAVKLAGYIAFKFDPVSYARRLGVTVGTDCRIQSNWFGTEPYLIELGDHVHIGNRVQFLTHDGAVWVVRRIANNPRVDLFGRIRVGNNVFLGNDVTILPGRTIGSNVIVGAGAVVASDIPSGVVAAGCPARVVGTVDGYIAKRRSQFLDLKGKSAAEKRRVLMELYAAPGNRSGERDECSGVDTREKRIQER